MGKVLDARSRFRAPQAPGLAKTWPECQTRPTTPEAYDRAAAALASRPRRKDIELARAQVDLRRQHLAEAVRRLAELESDDGGAA